MRTDDEALFYPSVTDALSDNGWSYNIQNGGYPKVTTKDGYELYFPKDSHFELTIKPEGSDEREKVFAYENNSSISPKYIAILEYIVENVEEATNEWGQVIINGQDN